MSQPPSQDMEEALPPYSIHTTLYLFFFTVAVIIVLSCGILLWSNHRVATAAQEMLVMDMTGSKSLTALRINLSQLEEDILSVHHGQDHGHRQAALDAVERATLHLEEADSLISLLCQGSERHHHMESHGSPSPFEELEPPLSQLNQILGEMAGWLNRIAQDELEFQDIQGAERRLQQWIGVELPQIGKKLHQLQFGMENHLEASIGQIFNQTKKNDRLGWIISVTALMAALLLGWLMVTRINHAVSVLQHSVTALEENRFTGKMHFSLPFSELAQLAQAFNRMAKRLDATLISREHLDRIIWTVSESIFVLDEQGEIHLANQAAKSLLGEENSGQPEGNIVRFFKEGDPAGHFLRHCLEQHQEFTSVEGVWPNNHGEDRLVMLSLTCLPSSLSSQQAGSMVLVVRDVTHRKQMEDQLRHLASHDLLTGLPNRALFMDRLQQAKKRANRQQTLLGLFFLSIDNIKNFNDTFGHGVGDWVLQRVAQVCQNTLRHSDTVARFGGNEFILLVEDAHTVRSLEELMLKLVQRLCEPAEVEGRLLTISVRMGGVIYPFLEEDALLLQTADIAMHHATREGGNRFAFYDHAMGQAFSRRTLVEHALDTALRLGEFQLLVQPKLWLANGQVLEVEALLRMHSSELGPVSPGEFIPLAEASGQILAIGEWVLREACAMASRWQKQARPMPAIAVNVSAKQIQQQGFVELVSHILQKYGIGKHQLAIEVTESAVMGAISQSAPVLYHLKRLGMSIAVDDFGTGHSSLAYLKQLPIDTLKIDRSFIKDLPGNRHDVAIVEAILAMAGHLDLKTVAEGVETLEQQEFLHSCGCQEIQGFYFARPMTEESFLQFIAHHDCAVKK